MDRLFAEMSQLRDEIIRNLEIFKQSNELQPIHTILDITYIANIVNFADIASLIDTQDLNYLTTIARIFNEINESGELQILLNIKYLPGQTIEGERPYLNFTSEIQIIDPSIISEQNRYGEIARFSISTSFIDFPFQKLDLDSPAYTSPLNMNINVLEDYRGKKIPRLIICALVFLLNKLFPENFNDSTYLYIDVDGSDVVIPGTRITFWDYMGMESNEENVIEPKSTGYEKRIQIGKLKEYMFGKQNATAISSSSLKAPNKTGRDARRSSVSAVDNIGPISSLNARTDLPKSRRRVDFVPDPRFTRSSLKVSKVPPIGRPGLRSSGGIIASTSSTIGGLNKARRQNKIYKSKATTIKIQNKRKKPKRKKTTKFR